jgi:ubiquitin-like protein ATG12
MTNEEDSKKEDGRIPSTVNDNDVVESSDTNDGTKTGGVLENNPMETIDTGKETSDLINSNPDMISELSSEVDEKCTVLSESAKGNETTTDSESKLDSQEDERITSTGNSSDNEEKFITKKQKVHCIAVGNAPLMKKTKFLIPSNESFGILQQRLQKMLKLPTGSSLFMYIHQSFVPSPDDLISDLGDCFAVNGELKIHYSLQEAWG